MLNLSRCQPIMYARDLTRDPKEISLYAKRWSCAALVYEPVDSPTVTYLVRQFLRYINTWLCTLTQELDLVIFSHLVICYSLYFFFEILASQNYVISQLRSQKYTLNINLISNLFFISQYHIKKKLFSSQISYHINWYEMRWDEIWDWDIISNGQPTDIEYI